MITLGDGVDPEIAFVIIAVVGEIDRARVFADLFRTQKVFIDRRHSNRDSTPFIDAFDDSERLLFARVKEAPHDEAHVIADSKDIQFSINGGRGGAHVILSDWRPASLSDRNKR